MLRRWWPLFCPADAHEKHGVTAIMTTIEQFEVVRMSPPASPDFVVICSAADLLCESIACITADSQAALRQGFYDDANQLLECLERITQCDPLNLGMLASELREIGFLISEPVVVSFVTDLPDSETEPPEDAS